MNPQEIFCPNLNCAARGRVGAGNISVHSQQEQRYGCEVCGTTFAATKGDDLLSAQARGSVGDHRADFAGLWLSPASDCGGLWLG